MENYQVLTPTQSEAWLCGAHGIPPGALAVLASSDAVVFGSGLLTLLVPGHAWKPHPKVDIFVAHEAAPELLGALGEAFAQTEHAATASDAFSSLVLRRFEAPFATLRVTEGSPRQALELAGVGGDVFVEGGALHWTSAEALGAFALLRTPCVPGFELSTAALHARLRGLSVFWRAGPSSLVEGQALREAE